MAEGLARKMASEKIIAYSAGSRPSGKVNPLALEVMNDYGINTSFCRSKGFSKLDTPEFDYVISLGCKDECPFVPAKKYIEWNIEDPSGKEKSAFYLALKKIEKRLADFLNIIN